MPLLPSPSVAKLPRLLAPPQAAACVASSQKSPGTETSPAPSVRSARLRPPEKTAILELPVYVGLDLSAIRVPVTAAEHDAAWEDLRHQAMVGFDTESKPTFVRGQEQTGPDLVQFATAHHAYLFQLRNPFSSELVCRVLDEQKVLKVGFGVLQDQHALQAKLGTMARPLLDVDEVFHRKGYSHSLGIKSAVAVVFNRRLMKSKRVTTSNWAARQLEPRQLLYAANDAYVALKVLQALKLEVSALPVWVAGVPLQPLA